MVLKKSTCLFFFGLRIQIPPEENADVEHWEVNDKRAKKVPVVSATDKNKIFTENQNLVRMDRNLVVGCDLLVFQHPAIGSQEDYFDILASRLQKESEYFDQNAKISFSNDLKVTTDRILFYLAKKEYPGNERSPQVMALSYANHLRLGGEYSKWNAIAGSQEESLCRVFPGFFESMRRRQAVEAFTGSPIIEAAFSRKDDWTIWETSQKREL